MNNNGAPNPLGGNQQRGQVPVWRWCIVAAFIGFLAVFMADPCYNSTSLALAHANETLVWCNEVHPSLAQGSLLDAQVSLLMHYTALHNELVSRDNAVNNPRPSGLLCPVPTFKPAPMKHADAEPPSLKHSIYASRALIAHSLQKLLATFDNIRAKGPLEEQFGFIDKAPARLRAKLRFFKGWGYDDHATCAHLHNWAKTTKQGDGPDPAVSPFGAIIDLMRPEWPMPFTDLSTTCPSVPVQQRAQASSSTDLETYLSSLKSSSISAMERRQGYIINRYCGRSKIPDECDGLEFGDTESLLHDNLRNKGLKICDVTEAVRLASNDQTPHSMTVWAALYQYDDEQDDRDELTVTV